jgi:hypothetical protein
VTGEYWISPLQLIGSGNTLPGQEVTYTNEGYARVQRPSSAGYALLTLYIDVPESISGIQQRIQRIEIHYAVENALDWISDTYVRRLNDDGTSTDFWVDHTNRNSIALTSYGYTDASPEAITGPISIRMDLEFNDYGSSHEILIGGVKVWTTQ